MKKVTLRELKKGTYIKRKENSSEVYKLIGYDRSEKKYCLQAYSDISKFIYLNGKTVVFVGFDF